VRRRRRRIYARRDRALARHVLVATRRLLTLVALVIFTLIVGLITVTLLDVLAR
jgi:hypothetical protein